MHNGPLGVEHSARVLDMNNQFSLLDLFCGAGGAAVGYKRMGFHVVGVDINKQPRYKGDEFIQADACEFLTSLIKNGDINSFDAVHASAPCQAYSILRHLHPKNNYPALLPLVRELLDLSGLPYVMENVEQAPMAHLPLFKVYNIVLCGNSFNLRVYRHRKFESNFPLVAPPHKPHEIKCAPQGRPARVDQFVTVTGNFGGVEQARLAMDIDWMVRHELSQAIPPAYTAFIGKQLAEYLHTRSRKVSDDDNRRIKGI